MIFKTFDNDLTGLINKVGLFNKSLYNMGRDFKNGNGLFTSLFSGQSVTSKDIQSINAMNQAMKNGSTMAQAWQMHMTGCTAVAKQQAKQCLINKGNLSDLTSELNQNTISAKASQVALKGLSIAGNMLAMWGISVAIQTAVKWIDKLVHSAEYAEKAIKAATESAKSFSDSIKDIQKETVDMEKSIDSIIDRYAKLSQGVNTFTNENISLPTDQYEEFLGLNKQLTELFPSLTRNYDENGNAILGLSGSVDSVTESIRSLVEQEKELARAQIRENLEKYFEGTDEADGAWKALEGRKQKLEEANEALTTLKNTYEGLINADTSTVVGQYHKNFAGKEQAKYIEYIKDNFGEDIAKAMEDAISIHLGKGLNGQFADLVVDFSKLELTETQKEQIARSYDTFYSELLAKQKTAMSEFESQNSEFSNNAMLWLEDLSFYKDNDKYTQTAIQNLVRNIDWSNYDFEELDYEGVKRILQDSVLTPFQIACEDPSIKKSLDDALKGLFTMDTSDMSVDDITSQVDSYINTIATAIGEDSTELKIKFGFDDTDTLPLINNVTEKLQDEFVDRVGELKIDELQIAAGLEIPNATLLSWDELITKIKEVQDSTANENPISISITDTVEQLNTQLKPAFDSLQSAWQDIFTDDGFELNSIDILSTCDSIKSKLDEMSDPKGLNLDVDYSAFEDFVAVLSNTESTASDVQDAFNSLATSITQAALSGAEDFETMKAALEDLGVVNNEMVAFDALISNTEALKEAGLDLAKASEEQIAAFANESVAAENVTQAIAMLTFHKELCNIQEMNTAGEVADLKTLAENAGYTGEVIQYLTELEQIYQEVASGTITPMQIGFKVARAAMLKSFIDGVASNINYEPKVDFSKATDSAKKAGSKSGKKAADAYLEAFEKELEKLQGMRDRNEITEKEYLDRLRVA